MLYMSWTGGYSAPSKQPHLPESPESVVVERQGGIYGFQSRHQLNYTCIITIINKSIYKEKLDYKKS